VAPVGGPGPWSDVAPNYFAIPFGLIGLAAAWKTASVTLRGPGWVSPVLLVAAATAWLAVCAAYLVKTARRADAVRADLPEFIAWALIYQAEAGDLASLPLGRAMAGQVANPALKARAAALGDLPG